MYIGVSCHGQRAAGLDICGTGTGTDLCVDAEIATGEYRDVAAGATDGFHDDSGAGSIKNISGVGCAFDRAGHRDGTALGLYIKVSRRGADIVILCNPRARHGFYMAAGICVCALESV